MQASEFVTKQFSLQARDLVTAQRIYNKRGSRTGLMLFIIIGLVTILLALSPLIILGVMIPQEGRGIIPAFIRTVGQFQCLIWPVGASAVLQYRIYPQVLSWLIRRAYNANKHIWQDNIIHFTEQGVDWQRPDARSHFDWSYFRSVIDHKDYFLLDYGGQYFIVPKVALEENQRDALAQMLKGHIAEYKIKG